MSIRGGEKNAFGAFRDPWDPRPPQKEKKKSFFFFFWGGGGLL